MKERWWRSLALQITAAQLVVVTVAVLTFVVVFMAVTLRAADVLVRETDIALARRLAPWLERYHEERGSFEGIERILQPARSDMMRAPMMPGMPMMPMMPMVRVTPRGAPPAAERWRGRVETEPPEAGTETRETGPAESSGPIALFTMDGRLIAAVGAESQELGHPQLPVGMVIASSGTPVARLYVGSMIATDRAPVLHQFQRSVRVAALATAPATVAVIFLMTALWIRVIVRPLQRLARAAARIGEGELAVRVPSAGAGEVRLLSDAFNTMTEQLAAQESARRRFMADAAHELRTPVTLLKAQLEMLEAGAYRWDEHQLAGLQHGVERLALLIADLQTMARLDAAATPTARTRHNPAELVRHAVSGYAAAFAERGVSLHTHVEGDLPPVLADAARVEQVLHNLLSNALRHSPRGSAVRVDAEADNQMVWFRVSDQGPGIPPELRERVFERFFRGAESRAADAAGSGLGLAISRVLVERQGGVIRVGECTRGARVEFALPRYTNLE